MKKSLDAVVVGDLFVSDVLPGDSKPSRHFHVLRGGIITSNSSGSGGGCGGSYMSWVDIEEINKHLRKRKATQHFDTKKQMDLTSLITLQFLGLYSLI